MRPRDHPARRDNTLGIWCQQHNPSMINPLSNPLSPSQDPTRRPPHRHPYYLRRQDKQSGRSFRWLSASLQNLQCDSNRDTAVLHWAIDFQKLASARIYGSCMDWRRRDLPTLGHPDSAFSWLNRIQVISGLKNRRSRQLLSTDEWKWPWCYTMSSTRWDWCWKLQLLCTACKIISNITIWIL